MISAVFCELCERPNVYACGKTHFGGYRFNVCSDCRTIVSEMRGKIAQLPAITEPPNPSSLVFSNLGGIPTQKVDIPADPNKTASVVSVRPQPLWLLKDGTEHDLRGTPCPKCGKFGTLGPANADGRPGCHACLWQVYPIRCDAKGNQ